MCSARLGVVLHVSSWQAQEAPCLPVHTHDRIAHVQQVVLRFAGHDVQGGIPIGIPGRAAGMAEDDGRRS